METSRAVSNQSLIHFAADLALKSGVCLLDPTLPPGESMNPLLLVPKLKMK